jgi:hypothetical protein
MITPDKTSIIGKGNLYLLLITPKKVIAKSRITIRLTSSIIKNTVIILSKFPSFLIGLTVDCNIK